MAGEDKEYLHGRVEETGKEMKTAKKEGQAAEIALAKMKSGQSAVVVKVDTSNRSALNKLIAMQILPKVEVEILQTFPAMVIKVGRTQFAIDEELASHVIVKHI